MGEMPPVSEWIPEDDVLLVNAVEAGASLESLAKGAVQFSRRFNILELEERWHSLLYDPLISVEASDHMTKLQDSASGVLSNSTKFGVPKGNESLPGKRKEESVRSLYYAMRKRICTETLNSVDLSFLVLPTFDDYAVNGDGCQEQLTLDGEHPNGNYNIEDPILGDFELQDSDFDIACQDFPHITDVDPAAGFVCGNNGNAFENLPDGIMGRDSLYGFAGTFSPVIVNEAVGNDIGVSFDHDNVQKGTPTDIGESLLCFNNNSSLQEIGSHQECMVSALNSYGNNPDNVCSELGGNHDFGSPIWKTVEDIAMQTTPAGESIGDKYNGAGDTLTQPGNVDYIEKVGLSGYKVEFSGNHLEEGGKSDGLATSAALSETDFIDLENSLLNFTKEELLFMDDDNGEGMLDRSCLDGLNSFLLGNPADANHNDITDLVSTVEIGVVDDPLHSSHKALDPDIVMEQLPSRTSALNLHSPERVDGVICCVLNTEDPEIPCNDDLFLPCLVSPPSGSSGMQHKSTISSIPSFHLVNKKKPSGTVTSLGQSELPERDSLALASPRTGSGEGVPSPFRSVLPAQQYIPAGEPDVGNFEVHEMRKYSDSDNPSDIIEMPIHGSDIPAHNTVGGCKQEAYFAAAIQSLPSTKAESGYADLTSPDPVLGPLIPEQEEHISEDDDVPFVADIEAMILNMDLGPCNLDSSLVSNYRHEDTKKAIIRLEQGVNSYMQKTIVSHGAFALLYGRHSKHYIRKSEILLGRETQDNHVDINLEREGRANKISRRQAIIKMEEDGTFYLINLAKGSIFVNKKELTSGYCTRLGSNSVVEIQGMRFLFEVNQNAVRQHLAKNARRNRDTSMKFEWAAADLVP